MWELFSSTKKFFGGHLNMFFALLKSPYKRDKGERKKITWPYDYRKSFIKKL